MRSLLNVLILIIVVVSNIVSGPTYSAEVPTTAIEEVRFKSDDQQTVMIELFTSQGCSSCPPAEKYLNSFVDHPDLWKKYIPVAFHVDYWDYIGWKDIFAKPKHGVRQREYAYLEHTRAVYTPAFIVNGKAWRKSFYQKDPKGSGKTIGSLDVSINNQQLLATFTPSSNMTKKLVFNYVVLGFAIETKIKAGERHGKKSHHEFVVLDHKTQKSSDNQWEFTLPDLKKIFEKIGNKPERLAIAAWISNQGDPTPIQATGGYLHQH